jgi:hypothetical protein
MIILYDRIGRNGRASQETTEEKSREELRNTIQSNEEIGPTGKSTAVLECIKEFTVFLNRIPCFSSINAPSNRGSAFENAIASSISRSTKTSYQISRGRRGSCILVGCIGSGCRVD